MSHPWQSLKLRRFSKSSSDYSDSGGGATTLATAVTSNSEQEEEEVDVISKLTRRNYAEYGGGESLQAELREGQTSETDSDFDLEGGILSTGTPTDTATDTGTDQEPQSERRGRKGRPLSEAMKEKLRRELTGPSKFEDPTVRKALERRAMRYSIAGGGGKHLVELGSSVESTLARNLPGADLIGAKDNEEYLQRLRERRRSRAQLARAHNLITGEPAPAINISAASEPGPTISTTTSSTSPRDLASPPKMDRSVPEFSIADLTEEEEDEEGDVIDKLVGRTGLLKAPTRGRKISLQEELSGISVQGPNSRPIRSSFAGDIAGTQSIGGGGAPAMSGLIIPDKWKGDFAPSSKDSDSMECSSGESCGKSEEDVEEKGEVGAPHPTQLLGFELSQDCNNDSGRDESDVEQYPAPRIKKRKCSSERRRSHPELHQDCDDSDEEMLVPIHRRSTTAQSPCNEDLLALSEVRIELVGHDATDFVEPLRQEEEEEEGGGKEKRSEHTGNVSPGKEIVEVDEDGRILKKQSSPFRYLDSVRDSKPIGSEEEKLRGQIAVMQEEIAKSDLIIAELNMTIEDLREYNARLENDIKHKDDNRFVEEDEDRDGEEEDRGESDEWLNLEIEVARLQKEVGDRDTVIRAQKDALDKTLSKGSAASPRAISLAGAVKQALDVNASEMGRLYKETLRLCNHIPPDNREEDMNKTFYEQKLEELNKRHFALIEELGVRHTDELQTLRNDYEVLLELAVKEKEKEMRNTIIEDSELEDLAGQMEELTEELKRKEKRISELELTTSALRDEAAILRQQATSQTPPQIVIEDPDGEARCPDCDDKDRVIGKLREQSSNSEDDEEEDEEAGWIEERRELMQQLEHLKLERDEAKQMATARTKAFYNGVCEKMGDVSRTVQELKAARDAVRGDLHRMRVEVEQYSAEIAGTVAGAELRRGEEAAPPSVTAPVSQQPQGKSSGSGSRDKESSNVVDMARRDKEIFELKVKMKEQQAKLLHMTKRLKEAREVAPPARPNIEIDVTDGPEREKKLLDMLQQRDTELHQARRLHGQNLATIKRRHDKATAAMQDRVEKLELTIQQLLNNRDAASDPRRRAKSMVLPQTPAQPTTQNESYIIMQQCYSRMSPRDAAALFKYPV